jgi:probable rRNA maturation factor
MKLSLHVQYASACGYLPDKSLIAAWARAALEDLPNERVELGVRIVDEPESAGLNQRYRHQAGPTNVLSFPFNELSSISPGFLGDLVICAPVVQREAAKFDKPLKAHWAHMVIHGIMHLRGYDHVADRDARIMEAVEAKILERLGFNNPYPEN